VGRGSGGGGGGGRGGGGGERVAAGTPRRARGGRGCGATGRVCWVRVDYAAISIEQRGFFAKPAGGGAEASAGRHVARGMRREQQRRASFKNFDLFLSLPLLRRRLVYAYGKHHLASSYCF
jgi:hypothetical protein